MFVYTDRYTHVCVCESDHRKRSRQLKWGTWTGRAQGRVAVRDLRRKRREESNAILVQFKSLKSIIYLLDTVLYLLHVKYSE